MSIFLAHLELLLDNAWARVLTETVMLPLDALNPARPLIPVRVLPSFLLAGLPSMDVVLNGLGKDVVDF